MKRAMIVLCLALAACASPSYDTAWPDPQGGGGGAGPSPVRSGGDIYVEQERTRNPRADAQGAAEQCARYGRVATGVGGERYSCVSPAEAVERDRASR